MCTLLVLLLAILIAGHWVVPAWTADTVDIDTREAPPRCPRRVTSGDFVRFHYNGSLPDGTPFESSYSAGEAYAMFVGKEQMTKGLDLGLLEMCVNELRLIKIPPHLAYGSKGVDGKIPADSSLHFSVQLLDVWNLEDKVQVESHYIPEQCPRKVQSSDYVRYHYNGTLLDGTSFDSSYSRNQTYNTYVGIGWLIAGMDQGLIGMCIGEHRHITIPPVLAYGEKGYEPVIPPQASLVFNVVLLDLHNPKDTVVIKTTFSPDNCTRRTQAKDFIRYHYNGTLLDGTMFDSSYQRNKTYNTYLGMGYIIKGMDEGLLGMCTGEHRTITMPPHLAYGEQGAGSIPGSAVLVFDVILVDFHNPTDEVQTEIFALPDNCVRKSRKGDLLRLRYNTTLMDGTLLDSSDMYGKTYNVVLGSGRLVSGMESALAGMCVSEKRRGTIPPHLAYGEEGIAGDVPGSAVLLFDVELIGLEEGLPDGYLFIWHDEVPSNLFELMDGDKDEKITLEEFSSYIKKEVDNGKGRLAPGFEADSIIKDMFSNQDRNKDGEISAPEFKLKADEDLEKHDEL
uniref:peptidylprolyl isomerase n=1 Tax=Eptatretus burgeri TaxID=7764 RepID=A0A8C4NBS0_EPTBU